MKGSSCMVVGGAGGMGVQICRKLLENETANLAIVDIQMEPRDLLDELRAEHPQCQIIYFVCDVSVKANLAATFKSVESAFGGLHILINAAGIFNDKNVELTFKVNVFGLIYSTMLGSDVMGNASDAVIINIASLVGLDPLHLLPIYTASKHAIVGFSRAFSHDTYYGRSAVRIVVLCPGATTTHFAHQFSGNMIVPDEANAMQFFRSAPKQSTERVAEHVMELVKNASNGSIWLSDNGQLTEITMTKYCTP